MAMPKVSIVLDALDGCDMQQYEFLVLVKQRGMEDAAMMAVAHAAVMDPAAVVPQLVVPLVFEPLPVADEVEE